MQTRAVQVILLICSLILAIIILIASSKYGAWAHEMVPGASRWLPLVFYVGTIPFISLLYTVSHLAALQFNGLPCPPYPDGRGGASTSPRQSRNPQPYDANYTVTTTFFVFCVSIVHTLMWFAQSVLCTSCELAPILAGHQGQVPRWCPQSRFHDTGNPGLANMLGTLATVKDFLQWAMVALAAGLVECARREWMRAEHVRGLHVRTMGAGVDFGGYGGGEGENFPKKTTLGGAAGAVELSNISGPRLVFRAEEEAAARQREREQEETRRRQEEEERKRQWASGNGPLPTTTRTTGNGVVAAVPPPNKKDNYYGNGMGLKRSGTLNHMYESRV
ncbi:uncharacterized protein PV07_03733 [Cladophialophora immunda]|uniref:Uncharacterized protein n=1 Tax=Cladophialophora immunda TaxID=569365 RepID=A0A0D2CLS1_9EURO|nr:uncharacterized protein PV07_03733 [Cladophialophora immunda]KIW32168.1 hypothetical protein PV07_03733 [Cladophialophora immunda]